MSGLQGLLLYLAVLIVICCQPEYGYAEVALRKANVGGCNTCELYDIVISGRIDQKTLKDFTVAANDHRIKKTAVVEPGVVLNSPGGSVVHAIAIGEIVREKGFRTGVFVGSTCESACTLILAAGVLRTVSGRVGIHRPRFEETAFAGLSLSEARKKYSEMGEVVRQYLRRMGIKDGLYQDMLAIPSDEIRFLSEKEAAGYALDGRDPVWSEWRRAKAVKQDGPDQYAITQSYGRVLAACMNYMDRHARPEKCSEELQPLFKADLALCLRDSTKTHIACAQTAERKLLQRFR